MSESAAPSRSSLLEVRALSTGYGDLRVVRDISLEVHAGEITALLGRNGAGKTTTLRAIAGLNRVKAGEITFEGESLGKLSPHDRVKAGVAFVQEGKRVFRSQTIEQNLLLGGFIHKRAKRELRDDVQFIYELFPMLRDKRRNLASSMSGGQQQMLAIGQALMAKPKLLLLDEPSGGLAPVVVKEVMERVNELKATGIGILLVEQAVEASFVIADRVVVVDSGVTVLSDRADRVNDITVLQDAYFGFANRTEDGAGSSES